MADYIFTMKDLTKVHPPDKKVLEDIYLSFLPGAKIGVLGVNGSGKSSLLRIMAGVDKDFTGEAWARPGATDRLPAAGAGARRGQDRARERRGGGAATRASCSRASRSSSMKLGETCPTTR